MRDGNSMASRTPSTRGEPVLSHSAASRAFTVAAMAEFLVLGLPDGMIGVAWPEMGAHYRQPVSALSVLLLASTCGFFVMSSVSGLVVQRFGARPAVVAASFCGVVGTVGIASGRAFWVAIVAVAVLGGAGGIIDSALSSVVSMAGSDRMMSLLHGIYGAGAALAPLIIAAWAAGSSWQGGYATLAVVQCAVLVCWLRRRARFPAPPAGSGVAEPTPGGPSPRNATVVGMLAFFFASGFEIAAGAWAATYLVDHFHLAAGPASICVFGYWASLSGSRLFVGMTRAVLAPRIWILVGCVSAVAGSALFWLAPSAPGAVVGLVILGLGSGPMFPLLTSLTPLRVGLLATPRVIGWQLGAASIGAGVISGGVGLLVHRSGSGAIGLSLLVVSVVVVGFVALLDVVAPGQAPVDSEVAGSTV